MSHLNTFTKGGIRERMFRIASGYFGIGRSETLDPVICLFLEALGEEVYKVADEIDNLENRLLSGLSTMLVPCIDAIAAPAHTILHASSSESVQLISDQMEFDCSGLSFYPVCNTRIYKGDIRYFVHNSTIYSVANDQSRILQTTGRRKKDSNSFWIGLELDEVIENLSGLSFYIRFSNTDHTDWHQSLSYTEWKIQDQTLCMEKGLFFQKKEYDNEIVELFSLRNFSNRINASVKSSYDAYYLTVKEDFNIIDKREKFPESLKKSFSENVGEDFTQSLLWIEVVCPQEIAPEIIHSLQISINTFPVVNKRLVSETVAVNRILPVIPLRTDKNESFISVHSLSDSNGKTYYDISLNEKHDDRYGVYSLRQGGCERYNFRDAEEWLAKLIHSLEAEAVSLVCKGDYDKKFKKAGEEVLVLAKEVKKLLSKKQERYEIENYILTTPEKEIEIYFVEYWLTNGPDANGIVAGTRFRTAGLPVDKASLVNLLPTTGGRMSPLSVDKKESYRHSLSKPNVLVTYEDIKAFCQENFGHFLSDIQIRRGLAATPSGTDFVRTTDLHLQLHKEAEKHFDMQQMTVIEQLLKKHSPATYEYRIFVN